MNFGVLLLVLFVVYYLFVGSEFDDDRVVIFKGSISGEGPSQQSAVVFPKSYNQPQGLTYTYVAWILVKSFPTSGKELSIFSKKDEISCAFHGTQPNTIVINLDTIGHEDDSSSRVLIPNLSAMKWIHLAVVVDQTTMDVYVNGILQQHRTLTYVPHQSTDPVVTGTGWDGVLARMFYYPRSLKHTEIKKLAKEPLPSDLIRSAYGTQYFDMSWYIGRF